jgi:hypothetical protein
LVYNFSQRRDVMTISTFSVPIDIPWRRIAFSEDMMDKVACDRELPLRWRSSVAIFEYEPPEDQQKMDGFIVSYLKVACTITGYQPNDKEIQIRDRIARSGWSQKEFQPSEVNLSDTIDQYHACYGAMLEVVVAPPKGDKVELEDYPYFADFDPKKRELYELVTDTGEIMSRSLDDVGVRHGQTTSQSHEVRDSMSLGVSVSAGPKGGPGASAGIEHSTTDLNQRTTENVRTTDAERENRETLSHTTQLSQMYHQLNSYHLGTNRAAFFVLPRPHVVQSTDSDGTPLTFVDGPRQLEGIQEFMLVVVRPKNQEHICVEAYLETAHRVHQKAAPEENGASMSEEPWKFQPPVVATLADNNGRIDVGDGEFDFHKRGSRTYNAPKGYVIDTSRGDNENKGVRIIKSIPYPDPNYVLPLEWEIESDHVTLTVEVVGKFRSNFFKKKVIFPPTASFELEAIIFLKKAKLDDSTYYTSTLFITGRAACSCKIDIRNPLRYKENVSVVFEKRLAQIEPQPKRNGGAMSIHEANRLSAFIHREMLQSLSSADRYPRGMVSLLDTQLVSDTLAERIRDADRDVNRRLTDWPGVDANTLRRVSIYSPFITRKQLLQMPLARQVESFDLSFTEAVELRRALIDLAEPKGPPPIPERREFPLPLLVGMQLNEALGVLVAADLLLGAATEVDSCLPTGAIVTQEPAAGITVEPGTEISVKVASGLSVRLPEIVGLGMAEAVCRLRDSGLQSEPTIEGKPVPGAYVIALEPYAGTLVTPNAPVIIRLERRPPGSRP